MKVEEKIALRLTKRGRTLVVAESCTGGQVSDRLTDIPGSSRYFKGGIIAYANEVKTAVLDVDPGTIHKNGAVSRQVALAMAEGARRALSADMAAAVTGIAGPSGGSSKKPVGLAYIAFSSGKKKRTRKVNFRGNRRSIKTQFAQAVLKLILENI